MDTGAREPAPGEEPPGTASPGHTLTKVTDRRLARRPAGSRLGWSFLLVPLLVTGLTGLLGGPGIESDLAAQAQTALRAQGITGVALEADGVFVTAKVPTSVDPEKVRETVDAVDGVAAVTLQQVYGSEKERKACTGLSAKLDRATKGQRIPFVGRTAQLTAAGTAMVRAAAKLVAACGSARVYVGGHTDESTSDGGTLTLRRARTMIGVMRKAGVPEERLVPRGYGAQYLIDKGKSPAARARNERGSIALEGE
jgi:outer membrane protein OmpA-like peptidoglycan-associated protein